METVYAQIERLCFVSKKSFDEVLSGLYSGISRPNIDELKQRLQGARDLMEFGSIVEVAVGSAGLLEFLHLDLGAAIRVGSLKRAYRMIRIIAGNPMIMRSMTQRVPAAGSYAPITILIYQFEGDVFVCYDTLASLLAIYDNPEAWQIANDLDKKVIGLIERTVK
jgi:uncharacterized protein (DUF302 family)